MQNSLKREPQTYCNSFLLETPFAIFGSNIGPASLKAAICPGGSMHHIFLALWTVSWQQYLPDSVLKSKANRRMCHDAPVTTARGLLLCARFPGPDSLAVTSLLCPVSQMLCLHQQQILQIPITLSMLSSQLHYSSFRFYLLVQYIVFSMKNQPTN